MERYKSRSVIEFPDKDGFALSDHKAGAVDGGTTVFCAWRKKRADISGIFCFYNIV